MDESYMTTKEFCDKLQISYSTVYRMINNGQLPAVKFGRCWKIPRSVLEDGAVFTDSYKRMVGEIVKARWELSR